MKKILFLFVSTLLFINSCSSKSKSDNISNKQMTEREKSLETAKELDSMILKKMEELDIDTLENQNNLEIYTHNQILNISIQKIKVYSKEFTNLDENVIYETKNGDMLKISKIIYVKDYNRTNIEVELPSGKTGFIPLTSNPYKDGNFSFKEEINVEGNTVTVLNLKRKYTFEPTPNRPAKIQTLPDSNSEVLTNLYTDIRLDATAITADYKWLYVTYENYQGWISSEYLCYGIGGPVLKTPEEVICEELLWAGYR